MLVIISNFNYIRTTKLSKVQKLRNKKEKKKQTKNVLAHKCN